MINPDLGYYTCNGIMFNSKVDAYLYSATIGKTVEWIFNQDVFSKYPWHIEPIQSLDELYDLRARQLREKYDYLILSYSGGSDTNNILESFIRQGLHIDEIVTNHITKATVKSTILDIRVKDSWNFAAEHGLQAIPRLKYISEKLPRTKITELDVSDNVLNSMKEFKDVDWVLHRNDHLSIGQLFRYNYFHFSSIKKQFDKNLKIAIIVGLDKPKTKIKNDNKFYIYFNDATTNITTINDFNKDYTNVTTELFYWSKDSLNMLCKQAHVIKHWLEERPGRQQFWKNVTFSTVRKYHEKWLRSLIYTTWDNSWYQADKSTSWFNTEFDSWFRNDQSLKKEQELWKRGIQFLETSVPNFLLYNKNGELDSLKQFVLEYPIGEIKNALT
jgi:hypothetical protein